MFVCCPEKEAKKRIRKLNDLKNLVETIQEKMLVPCTLVSCPVCPPHPAESVNDPPGIKITPDIMVCYKTEKVEKKKESKCSKRSNLGKRTKRSKSRELRASILYVGCDCEKRNGLQDDCRRTECQGAPPCLTKPEPTCGPSEFSNGKHLGKNLYGAVNAGDVDNDEEAGKEAGKTTVFYNCYPAAVKC